MGYSESDKKAFERELRGYRFIGGKFYRLEKADVNKLPRLLHSVIFIGKNLVHIFASQSKIYTSLELDETKLKGSIGTTEPWALAMDFAPISSRG
ncbi:hypothetical protein [Campylobacter gracilis]|uniref:Uncharacterized protein n=1 Tax=Campylobacter gracilis RM3268 TaxID=553220 RepID=C8PLG2_9BACT|nr:hypothetical protein [Campylobacter gracilis]EEV16274.1 hypothetical protein CAMGR0001_1971 [Campylobacter gracilis RM3268]UEB44945.1 hypothetical protein LK410_08010 [Campylobacter gracilis]